jgi:hypothetical protein
MWMFDPPFTFNVGDAAFCGSTLLNVESTALGSRRPRSQYAGPVIMAVLCKAGPPAREKNRSLEHAGMRARKQLTSIG